MEGPMWLTDMPTRLHDCLCPLCMNVDVAALLLVRIDTPKGYGQLMERDQ